MEKLDPKISEWLRNHLIPRLASIFHEQFSENVECKVTKPRGSFFLSDLFFASIRFPGSCERKLLVKLPCQDSVQIASRDRERLFDNEILFYETLAVKTNKGEFPEYYLGGQDTNFSRFIVLEDVRARDYFVSAEKTSISLEYTLAGLKSIARFHGNTYALKEQSYKIFSDIKKRIVEIRYTSEINEPYRVTLNERIPRVTRALRARDYDPMFTEKISNLFEDCLPNIMMECVKPIEPLATIIHGDCTINNILYRFKDDGPRKQKLEALLIDFALLMYSSPAIDVSNFIYLCCSREDIKYRTEDLIKAYHDTLVQYLKDQKVWNQEKYSYDAFWKDYKRCAIFGYLIAVYFLPMMVEYEKNNNVLDMGQDMVDKCNTQGGGEALTNTLVDMLIDMQEAGMLNLNSNINKR